MNEQTQLAVTAPEQASTKPAVVVKKKKINKISISNAEKIGLYSNIATMLKAGIPMMEIIDSLLEDTKGNQRKLLLSIRDDLLQGQKLSVSFEKFPRIFDRVTVSILKASEESGTLDVALEDLRTNLRKEMEFSDKIKSALMYPIFIVIVFFAVLLMMLLVVIPKIATVFTQLHTTLPLPTKILIFMSNTVINHTILVVLGFILIFGAVVYVSKNKKQFIIQLLSMLPLMNRLTQQIDLARFTRSLYLLISSGLPITQSLDYAQEVVVRKDISIAIAYTKEQVSAGKKLSDGLKAHKKIMPIIILRIIEAGEKTGSLDKSFLEASEYLDYEVANTLKGLISLIEPVMLVVVGGLVGGMMMSIIAPIYSMIGSISPH